jgi:ABC-type phosphate transport system permease subunit
VCAGAHGKPSAYSRGAHGRAPIGDRGGRDPADVLPFGIGEQVGIARLVGARLVDCCLRLILWAIPIGPDNAQQVSTLDLSWASAHDVLNRLVIIDTHYGHLFSFWGSRIVHACVLIFDVSVAVAIAVSIGRRSRLTSV